MCVISKSAQRSHHAATSPLSGYNRACLGKGNDNDDDDDDPGRQQQRRQRQRRHVNKHIHDHHHEHTTTKTNIPETRTEDASTHHGGRRVQRVVVGKNE